MARDWTLEELKTRAVTAVRDAMVARAHVPGAVRASRTTRGTWYIYTRCANTQAGIQCSTESEYSVERNKVTKSTVSYWCQYENAEQKAARFAAKKAAR